MRFLVRVVLNALALMAVSLVVEGIVVRDFTAALLAAIVLGVVNATLRPLLVLISIPINLVTLGLFTFVINALLLGLVALVVPGFQVDGLWAAVFGALLLSVVSALLNSLAGTGRSR